MSLPVLTAVTGEHEAALVAALERLASRVRVVRRCADLADLLSAAGAGLGAAAVVSADLYHLDRDAVARINAAGVAVVGLADAGDPAGAARLRLLGAQRALTAPPAADELAGMVAAAVTDAVEALRAERSGLGPDVAPDQRPADGDASLLDGRLIVVWGPTGAPGRTTVAITLACELAGLAGPVLLVDADTYGASVAAALGLLDESAGIAAAARAAGQGGLDLDRLARLAPFAMPGVRVLTGLPRPSRWPELRAASLEAVWQAARGIAAQVVVDAGFALDADEELSFDVAAPRRNAATLSALAAADEVVAVGAADPIGLQRLVRGLSDLAEVIPPGRPPRVVVNRVRASAVGPRPERAVREALARHAGVSGAVLVPDDPAACDAALLAGRSLSETAPASPARQALARLAADIAGEAAPSTRDRRLVRRRRRG